MHHLKIEEIQKYYEMQESARRLLTELPVMARLDGKCFHAFTKKLEKPFDIPLISCFRATTQQLVQETGATLGYCQSDEISLIWAQDHVFFDGRIQKMTSVLASMTTLIFSKMQNFFLPYVQRSALFDGRVWQLPNLARATEYFEWREADAVKNSISMAAQAYFSPKQLEGKSSKERQEMLMSQFQVNWNNYSSACKRGSYYQRQKIKKSFSEKELAALPLQHDAIKKGQRDFERTLIAELQIPPLPQIQNKTDVLFFNEPVIFNH